MQCPFVYSTGKRCKGYIKSLELIKVNLHIELSEDDKVTSISFNPPRYHVHLYCSEKGNHAGTMRPHSEQLKVWWNDLPKEIKEQIESRLGGK